MTREEFEERKMTSDIIPWRDVPQLVLYRICDAHDITTVRGKATIVELIDAHDHKLKAFATSLLIKDLAGLNYDDGYYIESLGKKTSPSSNQDYYAYEIVKN